VSDGYNQDNEPVILDRSHDPVIADPIAPKAFQVARKRPAEPARILGLRNTLSQILKDLLFGARTKLAKLASGLRQEFNSPDARRVHSNGRAEDSRRAVDCCFKLFKRDPIAATGEPAARKVVILQILDVAQDRLARVETFGSPGLLGEGVQALFDVWGKAERQHIKVPCLLYMYDE
jgi:hypothetical protein